MRHILQLGTRYEESSFRAVQIEVISEEEWDEIAVTHAASNDASASDRAAALRKMFRGRIGACVKAVSKEAVKFEKKRPGAAAVALPPDAWLPCTKTTLLQSGNQQVEDLFTDKDRQALTGIIRRLHEVSQDDVNAMMGELIPVSGD